MTKINVSEKRTLKTCRSSPQRANDVSVSLHTHEPFCTHTPLYVRVCICVRVCISVRVYMCVRGCICVCVVLIDLISNDRLSRCELRLTWERDFTSLTRILSVRPFTLLSISCFDTRCLELYSYCVLVGSYCGTLFVISGIVFSHKGESLYLNVVLYRLCIEEIVLHDIIVLLKRSLRNYQHILNCDPPPVSPRINKLVNKMVAYHIISQ